MGLGVGSIFLALEGPARNGTKENYDRGSVCLWAAGDSSEIRREN